MKFRLIMMLAILLTLFVSSSASAMVISDPDLWLRQQTPFTSYVSETGRTQTIDYIVEDGITYFAIRQSGIPNPSKREMVKMPGHAGDGTGTGYFFIDRYDPTHTNEGISYPYHVKYCVLKFNNQWAISDWGYIDVTGDVGIPPSVPPGSIEETFDGNLFITKPPYTGYSVTSPRLTIEYGYGVKPEIPKPGKAVITGVDVVPLSHTGTSTRYDSENDIQYSNFKATVNLIPGVNTITVTLDYKGNTYEDSINVVYLTGVIDEDGDGIDDRTGLPIESDFSEISPDGAPLLPENPTILDYVKYAVDSIIYVFAQVGIAIKGMVSSVGDIGKILTSFFSFMPQPFTGIIVIGLLIAIILRIFGR